MNRSTCDHRCDPGESPTQGQPESSAALANVSTTSLVLGSSDFFRSEAEIQIL